MKNFFNYKNCFQPKVDESLAQTNFALLCCALPWALYSIEEGKYLKHTI